MLFITVLGTVLRLLCINKPDGLWNDEYVSWAIAAIPLGKAFWTAVYNQCHMPLYYFYLKFFIHFFGNSDLMLRLTSIPPAILSIITMYFVGKEFCNDSELDSQSDINCKSRVGLPTHHQKANSALNPALNKKAEKLGFLMASVTSLSSFLIYFSQEVRFYELLFLFSALSLLFTIRLTKKQNLSNLIFYIVSNLLIIATHTIGFIFVLLNLIFMSVMLFKSDEKLRKPIAVIWASMLLLSLGFCSLIFKILITHSNSQWWGGFTFSRFGFLITDYFSPVLTNIVSAPESFFSSLSIQFIIFGLIPSGIALVGITKAIYPSPQPSPARGEGETRSDTQSLNVLKLFCSSIFIFCVLGYVLILAIAAMLGKLVFVTKYSIEIYPILILLMTYGLLQLKKGWRTSLIFVYCFLSLFYMFLSPIGAFKIRRSEGHKIVANLLKNSDLHKGDFILINYYPANRFNKYFDFDKFNVVSINKGTFPDYLGVSTKDELRKIDNSYFDKEFKEKVLDRMKTGQKLAVVILNDVSVYSPMQMSVLFDSDKEYDKAPFMFLIFSYTKNRIMNQGLTKMQILRMEQKGSWSVITFAKKA